MIPLRPAFTRHKQVFRRKLSLALCSLLAMGQAFGENDSLSQPQLLSPTVADTVENLSADVTRDSTKPALNNKPTRPILAVSAESAVTDKVDGARLNEHEPVEVKANKFEPAEVNNVKVNNEAPAEVNNVKADAHEAAEVDEAKVNTDNVGSETVNNEKPDDVEGATVAKLPDSVKTQKNKQTVSDNVVLPAPPVAEDVILSEPVVVDPAATPQSSKVAIAVTAADEMPTKKPLVLLGEVVAPGTSARLSWSPDQNFDGISVPTPVLVVNGIKPGKLLCLTAAVHGDELNGIEIVRRILYGLDPKELSGAVIGVPIVNLMGFRRNSRYLPDRRDLNRYFPGSLKGSSASRIAHSFFTEVVSECDALVDIHTGSFLRTNLPQLRADMTVPEVMRLTEGFGATAVLHSVPTEGTLRRAAVMAGIPAVTLETGEPSRLQEKEINHGTKGIQTLLTKLEMTRRVRIWGEPEPVYYQSIWVRADNGGLLFNDVELGQRVREKQLLGTITDPITNMRFELRSPRNGRILGMALNQVVMPGFAAFRIGIPSTELQLAQPESDDKPQSKTTLPQTETVPQSEVDVEDENS